MLGGTALQAREGVPTVTTSTHRRVRLGRPGRPRLFEAYEARAEAPAEFFANLDDGRYARCHAREAHFQLGGYDAGRGPVCWLVWPKKVWLTMISPFCYTVLCFIWQRNGCVCVFWGGGVADGM